MRELKLNRHPVVRAAHYLFLLPFAAALWPLIRNPQTSDLIIYGIGLALVLSLIIQGNRRPLLISDSNGLHLYLHHNREAEFQPFSHIVDYHLMRNNRISITLKNDSPIALFLKRRDLEKLADVLESGIKQNK